MNIDTQLTRIIVDHLGVEEEAVKDDAAFIDDLGADSLDTVELVMAFEEEFDMEIPDRSAEQFVTVKDAKDYILTVGKLKSMQGA